MNFKNNARTFLIILSLAGINVFNTSCSKLFSNKTNKQPYDPAKTIAIKSHDKDQLTSEIETQLIASAHSIERSLASLAANQEINNLPVLNTAPLITPEGGMGMTADIDWTGPIEPLLKKIAELTNYNLKILGNPNPIPIIVSITEAKVILADILKNAGLQAGKRASIVVFPANKVIELRYRFGAYNSKLPEN